MPNPLWLLTDPSGRVVGASASNARLAIHDAWADVRVADTTKSALHHAIKANPTASTYTVDGYTLARKEMDG